MEDRGDMISTIIHEIFHVTAFSFEWMGINLKTGVSDEAYAYFIGFLAKEIFTKVEI